MVSLEEVKSEIEITEDLATKLLQLCEVLVEAAERIKWGERILDLEERVKNQYQVIIQHDNEIYELQEKILKEMKNGDLYDE